MWITGAYAADKNVNIKNLFGAVSAFETHRMTLMAESFSC